MGSNSERTSFGGERGGIPTGIADDTEIMITDSIRVLSNIADDEVGASIFISQPSNNPIRLEGSHERYRAEHPPVRPPERRPP